MLKAMRILGFFYSLLLCTSCATTQCRASYSEDDEIPGPKKVGGYCLGLLEGCLYGLYAGAVTR